MDWFWHKENHTDRLVSTRITPVNGSWSQSWSHVCVFSSTLDLKLISAHTHTHTHIRLSPTRLSTSSIWMKLSESLKSAQTFTRAGPKQTARWEKHYKTSGVLDHTESAHSPDKQPQLQRLLWDQLNGISESWMRASVWQRRPDWRIYQVWMLSGNDYRTQNTLSLSAEYANMRITVLWKPHNTSNGEQHRYLYHLLLPSCSQVTEDANMTDFCASFLLKCC